MKRDPKFYRKLQRSSRLQHSFTYAQGYRDEDERSKNDVSHAGKCKIISDLSGAFHEPAAVLDLGCGTGRYFHCLRNVRFLVGVDPSENMLMMATNPVGGASPTACLVQGSLHEIEFKPESFDLVLCVGVFGATCPLDEFCLARIARFLKPHGMLFFTVPEYTPSTKTWKTRIAELLEPFLVGYAKRYVKLRLRRFNSSSNQVRTLLSANYRVTDISVWESATRRIDLHCIAEKQP